MQSGHVHRLVAANASQTSSTASAPPALDLFASVKQALGTTTCDVTVLAGPRAEAWEMAFALSLRPGDAILALGQCPSALSRSLDVERISEAGPTQEACTTLSKRLGRDRFDEVKAVFVTGAATSQVTLIRQILDENFHDALLLVDSAEGLGAEGFHMDQNEVDIAVIAQPGGPFAPSGHTILAMGPKSRPPLHIAAE